MTSPDDICVLIPTLNEAATIESVIDGFHDHGYHNILIVDGGSTDGTVELAESAGARIMHQSSQGKGRAIREAVPEIDAAIVLMLDGDGTYRPADADRMITPLIENRAEHVIGNRFADLQPGAMTYLHRFGNRVINLIFRLVHGRDLVDILSGYRAFSTDTFDQLYLTATGFEIETELAVECVRRNVSVEVVPISYHPRPANSEANLRSFRHGTLILTTLYRLAKMTNPLFYFGSLGVLSSLLGLGIGIFVGIEWFTRGISHEVMAIVASFAILFGIQLLMFGLLSDMLIALHREQLSHREQTDNQ